MKMSLRKLYCDVVRYGSFDEDVVSPGRNQAKHAYGIVNWLHACQRKSEFLVLI